MRAKSATPSARAEPAQITVFQTRLGWTALVGTKEAVRGLSFGHASARAALAALAPSLRKGARRSVEKTSLAARLTKYAAGNADDFADISVDFGPASEFRRRVMDACRAIPYGETRTYGQLAALAGSPKAARAVGRCMATNPIPLVVPCHRVIPSNGRLGGYSGGQGVATKRQLLDMESAGSR